MLSVSLGERTVRIRKVAGPNPFRSTSGKALKTPCFQGFFMPWRGCFPLLVRNELNKCLHARCTGLLHLLRDMPVDVGCERRRVMPEVPLYRLNVVSSLERGNRVAVTKVVQTRFRVLNYRSRILRRRLMA